MIKVVVYSLAVIVVLLTFIFRVIIVDGGSMYNTLCDKQRVLVTNYQDDISSLQRGDIIAVAASTSTYKEHTDSSIAGHNKNPLIKRIIAVAGDTIGFDTDSGNVYINGKIIDEPYVYGATFSGVQWEIPDVIPEGYVFVMGDNRGVSKDSRSSDIRLVCTKDIIGKAQFILYPFSNMKYLY